MLKHYWVAFFVVVSWVFRCRVIDASAGDDDPHYRACLQECEETGCVAHRCFPHCNFSSGGGSVDSPWFLQEPLYLRWKQWDCQGNCRYYCMVDREKEREAAGYGPVKYHGKWPFKHVYGIQRRGFDRSSAVAILGSLIIAILRCLNVRDDAVRVMVAAPLLAFVTTHILYLNFYKLDYGWNMKVCFVMGVAQLLIWAIWAGVTHHPSRWKLWVVVVGGGLAMLLEIYDFPPYEGFLDAHAVWHATTIPLTYIWWSFIIRDDAEFLTSNQVKKLAKKAK